MKEYIQLMQLTKKMLILKYYNNGRDVKFKSYLIKTNERVH